MNEVRKNLRSYLELLPAFQPAEILTLERREEDEGYALRRPVDPLSAAAHRGPRRTEALLMMTTQ
jgi:hypothetical protein